MLKNAGNTKKTPSTVTYSQAIKLSKSTPASKPIVQQTPEVDPPSGQCKSFAEWARNPVATIPKFGFEGWTPFLKLNDLRQAIFLKHLQHQQSTDRNTSGLRRADIFGAITARSAVSEGETRLARFLAVLDLLGTAPWANKKFGVNEDILYRMVASHMTLIVGEKNVRPELYNLLNQYEDWSGSQNLVWVTNRQQGKTSTLARFTAALAHCSCAGGQLLCIYSVSLDRAQEVLKGAKRYIYWMLEATQVSKLLALGATRPEIIEDNLRLIRLKSVYGSLNLVTARPKNPDSCRGDAPKAAIFDEIAFVQPNFWYQFSYPLLQVGKRVFTCTTTPPALGSFFAVFVDQVKEQNSKGDFFFRLINHSLACIECLEKGVAAKCVHQLKFIPPWKSLLRFTQMKALVPAKRALEYEQEVYGIIKADGARYFPERIVEAVFSRKAIVEPPGELTTVWLGVDPASHFRSFMGLAALAYYNGQVIVLGLASESVARCDMLGVQRIVASFVREVETHPFMGGLPPIIVPIIECNSSEVTALSILNTIQGTAARTVMPWTKEAFSVGVSDGIGVFTSHSSKQAAITHCYTTLIDLRVFFSEGVDNKLLGEQLAAFHDDPTLGATGKTSAGGEDDLAMAYMIALYWSFVARNIGS